MTMTRCATPRGYLERVGRPSALSFGVTAVLAPRGAVAVGNLLGDPTRHDLSARVQSCGNWGRSAYSCGMAKPVKRNVDEADSTISSKRATPKGTKPKNDGPAASSRYTPPTARFEHAPSPWWVPAIMFGFLGLGLLMIVLNYMGVVPGGEPNGWYLLGGLAMILVGIMAATQYR